MKTDNLFNSKQNKLEIYKKYISQCTTSSASADKYSDFTKINFLIKNRYEDFTELLDYDDPVYLQKIYDELSLIDSFYELEGTADKGRNFKNIGNRYYHNALLMYINFLRATHFFENLFDNLNSNFINAEVKPKSLQQIYHGAPGAYHFYITALRTKPFLLLAGISGTGKSQKVQELAFMTCPDGELRNEGGTTPGNYCLVEVKPNWHDSTELLGYYSALSGKYELKDFIRFAYKASQNKDVPFFLCLDEMNLAPVEQYFAEYLSVLETRKIVGDNIHTQYLLRKEVFSNCELQGENGNLYSEKDAEIITYLKENGLTLPDNLFVIGTVNMDDTTHQFSRKVIDRAFTIEMNGGKMSEMFSPESKMLLEYRDEPIPKPSRQNLCGHTKCLTMRGLLNIKM